MCALVFAISDTTEAFVANFRTVRPNKSSLTMSPSGPLDSKSIVSRTEDFYKERRDATDTNLPQDEIEAINVGYVGGLKTQQNLFEMASDPSLLDWQKISRVLDVGCGYGALCDFLKSQHHYQGEFVGIDIVPEFIDGAIKAYATESEESLTQFICGDFLEKDFGVETFDVVFSIGALSVNQDFPEQYGKLSFDYARKIVAKCVNLAGSAVSLYFPNSDNIEEGERKPRMAYYSQREIELMVIEACGDRFQAMKFGSSPPNSRRTIVHVSLTNV